MADAKKAGAKAEIGTTGHSYDGIEELNTPLPRWWLWTFYITIVWGIIYTIAYPAWPLVNGATEGFLHWSTRANVAEDIKAHEAKNQGLVDQLDAADLAALDAESPIYKYASARGAAVFRANCIQCHGAGANGGVGYPNLKDDDWLWGGAQEDIYQTVKHGVRNTTDGDARYSEMPKFGEILEAEQIGQVVEFVYSLSQSGADAALAAEGKVVFEENCAACHGDEGKGDVSVGAPNLADALWLFGGDRATLTETVTNARFGVMPAWGQRLSEADVRSVAVYVHSLGGGE